MALALLARTSSAETAPRPRSDPRARSRYLFEDGRTREALATELRRSMPAARASASNRLLTQATRRVEFFQAVVDLGVENPLLSPDAVQLAYARSSREVRLEVQ